MKERFLTVALWSLVLIGVCLAMRPILKTRVEAAVDQAIDRAFEKYGIKSASPAPAPQ